MEIPSACNSLRVNEKVVNGVTVGLKQQGFNRSNGMRANSAVGWNAIAVKNNFQASCLFYRK
jgi:hypothetical protein